MRQGIDLALAGKDQGIQVHGWILLIASCWAGFYLLLLMTDRTPAPDETGYNDGVIRAGVIATGFWGLAGFLVGDIIAWQLAYPALNFDLPFAIGLFVATSQWRVGRRSATRNDQAGRRSDEWKSFAPAA